MAGLPQSGVELIAKGASGFFSDLDSADKAIANVGKSAAGASDPMAKLGTTAEGAGKGFSALQEVATGALRQVGTMAVSALAQAGQAVASFVGDSVGLAGDFEAGMNQFGAAAGDALQGGTAGLDQFKQLFLSLGAELPVSTSEVQQAAITLVKGGIDPAVIAAGGLKDSLLFAAAAGMSLNDAAELSIKMLGTLGPAMGTAAEQTAFLASTNDLLVKAAGASTLDVDKLGSAMLAAGGQAKAAGVGTQDFITTMGLISPSFDSAATAGTAYKNFLARMAPSTKPAIGAMIDLGLYTKESGSAFFDATGKFVGNRAAAELLKNSLAGLSDNQRISALQTIFGNDAMGAAIALASSGASGYDLFAQKMEQANGVQAQAAATQQGWNIALDNAKGSVEALQISLGSALLPILTTLFNGTISPAINTLTTLTQAVMGSSTAFASLSPTLQGVATTLQTLGGILTTAFAAFQSGGLGAGIAALGAGLTQLSPTIGAIVSALAPLGAMLQANLIPILASVAAVVTGSLVVALATAALAFAPMVAAVAGAVAVGAVLMAAWQADFGGIQGIVSGALSGIVGIVTSVGAGLVSAWQTNGAGMIATAQSTWATVSAAAGPALQALVGVVSAVLTNIVGFWNTYGPQILAVAAATWNSIVTTVGAIAAGLLGIITPILQTIQAFIAAHGAEIQAFFARTWTQIGSIIQTALAIIQTTIVPILQGIGAFIAAHSAQIQAVLSSAWTIISTVITTTLSVIQGVVTAVLQGLQGNWSGAWNTIKETCATVVKAILTIIQAELNGIGPAFTLVMDGAHAILVGFVGKFTTVGGNIIDGIIKGIKGAVGALASAVATAAQSALDAGKKALGIASPSKEAADQVGVPFVQGIVVGIEKSAGLLKKAARTLSKQLTEEMKKVATDAAEAFTKALQAGLDADVGFKNTALDNLKSLQDLRGDTSGLKSEQDKLKQLQQELADLQAGKAPGGGGGGSDSVKVARELEDYTKDYNDATGKMADLVSERDKKLADIQASSNFDEDYYDAQGKLVKGKISMMADLNADYADKMQSAQDRIDDINLKHTRFQEDQAASGGGAGGTDNSAAIAAKQAEIAAQQGAVAAEQGREATRKQIADYAAYQISVEKAKADQISKIDAKTGAAYFALRSQQILDIADLEAQQADARAKGDNAAVDDISAQLSLTRELQAAQTAQFAQQAKADSPYAQLITDLTDLQNKLQAEKEHDAYFRDMNDKNSNSLDERRRYEKIDKEVQQDQAALDSVTAQLAALGSASIDGIVSGVQGQQTVLDQAIVDAMNAAQAEAKQALGIHSPSTVFADAIGKQIPAGIAMGIERNSGMVWDSLQGLTNPTLVTPAASAGQISNSSYNYAPSISIDARGAQRGAGPEIASHVNRVLDSRTAAAATRRRMA